MNLTYRYDRLLLNGEEIDVEDPAAFYASAIISDLERSMEDSPNFRCAFFEMLRPAAQAYYQIKPHAQESDWKTKYDSYMTQLLVKEADDE